MDYSRSIIKELLETNIDRYYIIRMNNDHQEMEHDTFSVLQMFNGNINFVLDDYQISYFSSKEKAEAVIRSLELINSEFNEDGDSRFSYYVGREQINRGLVTPPTKESEEEVPLEEGV